MEHQSTLRSLPDDELLRRTAEIVSRLRRNEAEMVAHIAEVDERRLYARQAFPSMFAYCTDVLHFSEAEAFLRIGAARASREHPVLLAMLADGRLHLSAVARLAPHLTAANREEVLARAVHRSKREIEELVAALAPRPDAAASVRKLPEPRAERSAAPTGQSALAVAHPSPAAAVTPAAAAAGPASPTTAVELFPERVQTSREQAGPSAAARRSTIEPTAPGRYKVQFTAGAGLREKLERLQALMRDSDTGGDLAAVIEQAVTEKLERLEARRFGKTKHPRPVGPMRGPNPGDEGTWRQRSREIPAATRRAVRERDGGRCTYTDAQGRRCTSQQRLEYHHREPYGYGGEHSVENVCLLCGTHHALLSEADFGSRKPAARRPKSALAAFSVQPPPPAGP
jgi:hypothetical protein